MATKQTNTQLKLYTHSTYSTQSHSIYLGYLQQKLSSIDYTITPKVTITDWREPNDRIVLRKVAKNMFIVSIEKDCYYQTYSNLEEAVFDLMAYAETNLLPTKKVTLQ